MSQLWHDKSKIVPNPTSSLEEKEKVRSLRWMEELIFSELCIRTVTGIIPRVIRWLEFIYFEFTLYSPVA